MGQDNDTIRNRARALFLNNDQEKINKEYQNALELKGDVVKGKELCFSRIADCATR